MAISLLYKVWLCGKNSVLQYKTNFLATGPLFLANFLATGPPFDSQCGGSAAVGWGGSEARGTLPSPGPQQPCPRGPWGDSLGRGHRECSRPPPPFPGQGSSNFKLYTWKPFIQFKLNSWKPFIQFKLNSWKPFIQFKLNWLDEQGEMLLDQNLSEFWGLFSPSLIRQIPTFVYNSS